MIWNDIRGFIIPDSNYTTLWQMARKYDLDHKLGYYGVHDWGEEEFVSFTVEDIGKLYNIEKMDV